MKIRPQIRRRLLVCGAALALLAACQRETLLDLEVEGALVTPTGTYPVVWAEADHPAIGSWS